MRMLKRQMLNVNEIFSNYVEKGIVQFLFLLIELFVIMLVLLLQLNQFSGVRF